MDSSTPTFSPLGNSTCGLFFLWTIGLINGLLNAILKFLHFILLKALSPLFIFKGYFARFTHHLGEYQCLYCFIDYKISHAYEYC